MSLGMVSCMSCIEIYMDTSVVVPVASMFSFMPSISLSLFSAWLCLHSQSAMYTSGPCLYSMCVMMDSEKDVLEL